MKTNIMIVSWLCLLSAACTSSEAEPSEPAVQRPAEQPGTPTYVVIGDNDGIASASVMRQRVENLNALGIDAEFHLFPNLRHGFGLGIGTSAEGWEKDAVKFWEKYMK